MWRRREKKREILGLPPFGAPPFGAPTFGAPLFQGLGPPLLASTPFGAHPSRAPHFVDPKFNIPKLAEVEIGRSRNWPKSKLAEVEIGRSRNWPKSKKRAGRSRNWPKSIPPPGLPRCVLQVGIAIPSRFLDNCCSHDNRASK